MSTIASLTIPADEFALSHTLAALPALEFTVERTVAYHPEAVLPLVWATGNGGELDGLDELKRTLRADASVGSVELLADLGERRLYGMEWSAAVGSFIRILVEEKGTVLNACGRTDRWSFRVLCPEHDALSQIYESCVADGLTVNVERVHRLNGNVSGWIGLTEAQHETLAAATKRGFYDVPRAVSQTDLATELGISHQALSERLRRAHRQLAWNALLVERATVNGQQ